jgi:hypothetical protein
MADATITIRDASVFDDADAHRVDFDAEVDGEVIAFSLGYDALEALSGEIPQGGAALLFGRYREQVAAMAGRALDRGQGTGRVIVSENDLDQPA